MSALDEASKDLQEKAVLVDGLEADVAAGTAALQAKDGELSVLQQQLAEMQKQLEEALILLQAKLREARANSQAKDMQLSCMQQELAALEQQHGSRDASPAKALPDMTKLKRFLGCFKVHQVFVARCRALVHRVWMKMRVAFEADQ